MRISVVIPAFNEEGNIGRLVEETYADVPEPLLGEVIVVDDASDDGTAAEIKALSRQYPSLRYLRHGRRAGQSAALRTGVLAARCPVIATMDGDGQNDPADIMRLLPTARAARDASPPWSPASGRAARPRARARRRRASPIGSATRCSPTAARTRAAGSRSTGATPYLALPYFTSMHRYLPAFFLTYGHEIAYEPVNDRPRLKGASKYTNLGRALIGLYDLVGVSWLRKRTLFPPMVEECARARSLTGTGRRGRRRRAKRGASQGG